MSVKKTPPEARTKQVRKAMAHYVHTARHTHSAPKQTQHSTPPNQNISPAQQGSALVEVLVAAIIFGIALFALTSFQANVYRAHAVTGQQDIALELAQSQMNTFRNYTALTAIAGQFAYADIVNSTTPTTTTSAGAVYSMTWTVTDATNPTRKSVRVTVTWNDSTGATNTVNADSIIASIDPKLTGQVSQTLP